MFSWSYIDVMASIPAHAHAPPGWNRTNGRDRERSLVVAIADRYLGRIGKQHNETESTQHSARGSLALVSGGWGNAQRTADCNCTRGADGSPLDTGASELRPVIERYDVELRDLAASTRCPAPPPATAAGEVLRRSAPPARRHQLRRAQPVRQGGLPAAARASGTRAEATGRRSPAGGEIAVLIPFQQTIIGLEEARRRMETIDPQKSAVALAQDDTPISPRRRTPLPGVKATPAALNRAATRLAQLRNTFRAWFNFYDLYDPKFSWWVDAEYKKADEALDAHAQLLHTHFGRTGPARNRRPGRWRWRGGRGGGARRRRSSGWRRRWRARRHGASSGSRGLWAATRNSRALARRATTRWSKRCARP